VCETASCVFCALRYKRPPQIWRYGAGFKKAIADIDTLIAPSNYLKNRIRQRLHTEIVTIPNFSPIPPQHIAPSGYSNFLIYAGVLEQHKGIVQFVERYKEHAERTGLRLIVVGNGGQRSRIDWLVKRYDLSNMVVTLGRISRELLWSLLRDANALVIPSIWPENAPLVALEALSVGTPIVSSDRGGLPEIVGRLNKKLMFSWGDEREIDRAIDFSIDNLEKLRPKARAIYKTYFSSQAYMESYERLIQMS